MKKTVKKKKNRKNDKEYILLQNQINKYDFHQHQFDYNELNYNKNTWFENKIYVSNNCYNIPNITNFEKNKEVRKTRIIEILFDDKQQFIFQKWIKAYTKMYNETIKYIKTNNDCSKNYKVLRTKFLKEIRDEIINNSGDNKIKTHIIDTAIKLACSNYKSALTNKRLGYIKHFRVRYWRYNKSSVTLEIEKGYINKGYICKNDFGSIRYKDFDSTNLNQTCFIRYDRILNKYYLLIPEKTNKVNHNLKDTITLDPGIHTFMTGLTDNKIIKYGNESYKYILNRLNKMDKINNNKKIPLKLKKKITKRDDKKIQYKVNELHWKVIKNLTDNYKNILIGDMSVKGIVKNGSTNLNKMSKRIGFKLKFYQFRQRLDYKCNENYVNYKIINEKYTSKTCSNCGFYKENLGGSRIFNCDNCNTIIDRDVNACKCILLKALSD